MTIPDTALTISDTRTRFGPCPISRRAPAPCWTCTPHRRSWCWPTSGTSSPRGWWPAPTGVRALATASHSIAATFGYEDGENIPLDLHLDMVGRIVVGGGPAGDHGPRGRLRRRRRDRPPGHRGRRRRRQPRGPDEAARRGGRRRRGGARAPAATPASTSCSTRAPTPSPAPPGADRGQLVEEAIRRGRAFLEAGAPVVFVPGRDPPGRDRGPRRRARAAEAQRHQRAGTRCRSGSCRSSGSPGCRPARSPSGSR